MNDHKCSPPSEKPAGSNTWRCPDCQRRFVWSKRMIGRTMREGWEATTLMHDDRRRQMDADYQRSARKALAVGLPVAVLVLAIVIALIVWIVLRVT